MNRILEYCIAENRYDSIMVNTEIGFLNKYSLSYRKAFYIEHFLTFYYIKFILFKRSEA
jgi:hypothetical protein